jgi:2-polyprenyl-3-methyl-5-hydroxy-6-metoxy-1,4-benzoquinol methylase
MDQPDLDERLHIDALRSLKRINFFSRSAGILWPSIRRLAKQLKTDSLSVLDRASGGGDVPIALWLKARRAGLNLRIDGNDISPCAIDFAREQAARASAQVRFEQRNVLDDPPAEPYDVVTCSLFLHHLNEEQAGLLLRTMAAVSRHLVLVNDLERSPLGFALAKAATRILSRCEVVWIDGPRSVEGAFTLTEALSLAERAGLNGAQIARRWPCRYLLSWAKPLATDGHAVQAPVS